MTYVLPIFYQLPIVWYTCTFLCTYWQSTVGVCCTYWQSTVGVGVCCTYWQSTVGVGVFCPHSHLPMVVTSMLIHKFYIM